VAQLERDAAHRSDREKIAADRNSLPIFPYRDEFIRAVMENQVLVIVAETGAGKTTQVRAAAAEEIARPGAGDL
jgi:pre-mRNA-splicing factor ATP-dependent RNA helicase DHX16